ncbi:MAG: toxin-antitoxin system YwqK family antitoxin [Lutibacter sp.]
MKLRNGIVFILMMVIISPIFAQTEFNKTNAKGERIGVWKKYYHNGRLRYIGQFKNGKEYGTFKYYSALSSKYPIIEKTFDTILRIANLKYFNSNGNVETLGTMKGKNRVGKWTYFRPDGKTILSVENYKNGLLEGEMKTFYKNNQLTEIKHYKAGLLSGYSKRYTKEGIILEALNYENGKLNGLAKYYNIKGQLIYTGNYENDLKIGKWEYFENGKPTNIKKFKK